MGLAWLQRHGHIPIVLVGGGTGMVGDPSGKREERPVMSLEQIDRNARVLARQLARFLAFEGANAARIRNNADWLRGIPLMDFLRDTGKHFTLNYMLQKESVRSRMEVGITYTEFSYMLIQAYDFWHLWRTERCELQMGGSDQWGNITAGIELVGRREGTQVHGLVFPLVTNASGGKFGKSEAGNVWLDAARTSPYQFYQFWVNTDDRDVERYLKLFTFLRLDQIATAMAEHATDPGRRIAQRLLAREVTATVHGVEATEQAVQASAALFGGDARPRGAAGDADQVGGASGRAGAPDSRRAARERARQLEGGGTPGDRGAGVLPQRARDRPGGRHAGGRRPARAGGRAVRDPAEREEELRAAGAVVVIPSGARDRLGH